VDDEDADDDDDDVPPAAAASVWDRFIVVADPPCSWRERREYRGVGLAVADMAVDFFMASSKQSASGMNAPYNRAQMRVE